MEFEPRTHGQKSNALDTEPKSQLSGAVNQNCTVYQTCTEVKHSRAVSTEDQLPQTRLPLRPLTTDKPSMTLGGFTFCFWYLPD